jgi:phosphoglucomutase
MTISPLAGKPADPASLVDVAKLVTAYFTERPDASVRAQRVSFGTSGHRGSSLDASFNEAHILATTQAICLYRKEKGYGGPLFLGIDTHALSEPAFATAMEVLAANAVDVLADGIVVTPSHNPPRYGGFKYNPPSGGPADTDATKWIEERANGFLAAGLTGVARVPFARAKSAPTVHPHAYLDSYVSDLPGVVDLDAIRSSGIRIGADPLGGASVAYWGAIGERYGLNLEVVNRLVDPTFRFMTLDWDGQIRMDPSSVYAMARMVELKDRFDVAFANDTDADRHGIVTGTAGLMNPNHFLSAAVEYLYRNRDWRPDVAVGKTLVSTSMLDRVAADLPRRLLEVPVGFKWFVAGLVDGSLGFGGEESAGASFLRRDGSVWTTDKDGLIACLLAAELTARSGRDPAAAYGRLTARFGSPAYRRVDAPATREQRAVLSKLSPAQIVAPELAGEPVLAVLTRAPGNDEPIGGVKVVTEHGWFAARPSGTEDVYKVYAESFLGERHLEVLLGEAQAVVTRAFSAAGATAP